MTDGATLAHAIGGAALVAAALAAWPWFLAKLSHRAFTDALLKLIAADDLERAGKLSKVAPRSPFVVAVAAALAAASAYTDEPESERIARLRGAFRDKLRAELATRAYSRWFGLVALGALGVTASLVLVDGAPPTALVAPGIALSLLLGAWQTARGIARAGAVQGERIFGPLARARVRAA